MKTRREDEFDEVLKGNKKKELEREYLPQELITIPRNLYFMTVIAIITDECNPQFVINSIRLCFFVFFIQIFICVYFCYELREMD